MKWITRQKAKVDRIACPWLIKHFIDPEAEFIFVPPEQVLSLAEKEESISFDAPGAAFTHSDGKCTFEALIEHYKINDPAILKLARVVHGADVSEDIAIAPESAGLKAMAEGFRLISKDDHENIQKQFALYDALYAYFQKVSP